MQRMTCRFVFEDIVPNDGLTQGIGRNEVSVTLSRMKKGETTGIWMGFQRMCRCVSEKGLTRYQYVSKCIRAGECINGVER